MQTKTNDTTKPKPLFEELDRRENDGIEVSLLWNRADGTITVLLVDSRLDEALEIPVPSEHALDAFRHPYAYAAFHGLPTVQDRPERELTIH